MQDVKKIPSTMTPQELCELKNQPGGPYLLGLSCGHVVEIPAERIPADHLYAECSVCRGVVNDTRRAIRDFENDTPQWSKFQTVADGIAATLGTQIVRMRFALLTLRQFGTNIAFSATVVDTMGKWIDSGMNSPVPWPDSPFFAQWAKEQGWVNKGGYIERANVEGDNA